MVTVRQSDGRCLRSDNVTGVYAATVDTERIVTATAYNSNVSV